MMARGNPDVAGDLNRFRSHFRDLGHDPENWNPVFRKDHAPSKHESDNRFNLKQRRFRVLTTPLGRLGIATVLLI
jgi:hypothetical protein